MESVATDYFHGKLDRHSAEERLAKVGKCGSYLLRESDRKSGSFVLSYFGKTGINHFRITHVYGSYFIGGRQFNSLSNLIDYYTFTCDLLTEERLQYPIAPPEPITTNDRLFISILPYTKLAQSDELSFNKGDIFILQNDLGDGWLWCRDVRTGESGTVFSHLVEEIKEDVDPNEVFPWFHAKLSKADAVNKLASAGPGSFLVRPSDNSPGNYTLFYHVGSTIQRFLIVRSSENRYTMGGKCFDSLGQIIELYKREQIIEGHMLQFPVITTMSRAEQLSEATLSTSMRALDVKEKPQDVYNTVKMSREVAKRRQSSELRGWLLLKKSDLHKKWKSYFFVLNSRDRYLYYYEKPQQTKPKGLIELSYSYIYYVHESLFDSSLCFQLVEKCLPCFANHFYFRCEDGPASCDRWFNAIKKFTSPNQSNKRNVETLLNQMPAPSARRKEATQSNGCNSFEDKRALYITLIEANSLKTNQPFFVIAFNHDIKVAKSRVKTSSAVTFHDDGLYSFENLPPEVESVTIYMHQNSKKLKLSGESPQININLKRLKSDRENFDHWLEFRSLNAPDVLGYLRIKINYSIDIVMGISEYAPLEDLICDPSTEIISLLDQTCHRDHLLLARSLSNIFKCKRANIMVLRALIEREALSEMEAATLFRTSSLSTALLESYMRVMCQTALRRSLKDSIKRLIDDKICCELNPSRLESYNVSQKACENLQNLLDLLDELISSIYDSTPYYPLSVRYLFSCLQKAVLGRWPNEPLIRTRIVSGFLFLRLICPTILNPRQFNLVNENPSENAIRNLTLVAKCLQNLANLVDQPKVSLNLNQRYL